MSAYDKLKEHISWMNTSISYDDTVSPLMYAQMGR